jgi:hypothetical protein
MALKLTDPRGREAMSDAKQIAENNRKIEAAIAAAGGGGAPSGPAGGDLGGTYPNPTFAVNMATQAELDTHKGSSDHDGRYYTEAEVDALIAAVSAPAGGSDITSSGVVTVMHGMSGTPSAVVVTGTDGVGFTDFWITNVDSDSFDVNYDGDVAGFYWIAVP